MIMMTLLLSKCRRGPEEKLHVSCAAWSPMEQPTARSFPSQIGHRRRLSVNDAAMVGWKIQTRALPWSTALNRRAFSFHTTHTVVPWRQYKLWFYTRTTTRQMANNDDQRTGNVSSYSDHNQLSPRRGKFCPGSTTLRSSFSSVPLPLRHRRVADSAVFVCTVRTSCSPRVETLWVKRWQPFNFSYRSFPILISIELSYFISRSQSYRDKS